jgi:phage head maturation protease
MGDHDFGGYVTKAGLKCVDGRVITAEAFKHMNGVTVPLLWQHGHSSPDNVLGHVMLEARTDGVYGKAFFNDTKQGQTSKALVAHGDIKNFSIWANQLVEKMVAGSKSVLHGMIREVSLVLSGANPGALIDYVRVQHGEDPNNYTDLDDTAVIHTGLDFEEVNVEFDDKEIEHAAAELTVQDVYDSMSAEQKEVVAFLISKAAQSKSVEHADNKTEGDLEHQEGTDADMTGTRNIFEDNKKTEAGDEHVLTHDAMRGIINDAVKGKKTLKEAVEDYALQHGITNLEVLFPDARTITNTPEFNKRRTEWVAGVLNGTHHTPFSRIKTVTADITQDEARAKGYITGSYKKEEWFSVTKRTTSPTTVYKKQKLDRDDIIDIADFDVVMWMKGEMRLMLEEEMARAILIGDGRAVDDEDKIKDPLAATDGEGIRSILGEAEMFAVTVNVNIDDANSSYDEVIDAVLDGMEYYKGTGTPTFYTTIKTLNMFLKAKDTLGRRLYATKAEVAAALGVRDIVTVEPMNGIAYADLVGIIVNLDDYNIGADKGGEVTLFDDFDIDYNQYKYLIETRVSGALTKLFSALVIKKTTSTNVLVAPTEPTFVKATGVVTIPSKTGVVYKNADTSATLSSGAQTALSAGATLNVLAVPASGYYFETSEGDHWSFKRPAA